MSEQPTPFQGEPVQRRPLRERRVKVRHSCSVETACWDPAAAATQDPWPAKVENVSTQGIALTINSWFESGTLLAMELEIPDHRISRTLLLRVLHVQRQSNTKWLVGCAFVNPLTENQLQALL